MRQDTPKDSEWFQFHYSSIKVLEHSSLVATRMGKGVMLKQADDEWRRLGDGLPANVHVNRLQVSHGKIVACANQGLYCFINGDWIDADLSIGCYQYKEVGSVRLAATPYGLWSERGEGWEKTAYPNAVVYDFLYLPHYIILALDSGIALYDRYTGEWQEFRTARAITGLAVYRSRLLGVSENGELLYANKRGGFELYRFGNMFIFSLVAKGQDVFACSDRGLFRVHEAHGRLMLLPLYQGGPVTDIDLDSENYYLATLFQGVIAIAR